MSLIVLALLSSAFAADCADLSGTYFFPARERRCLNDYAGDGFHLPSSKYVAGPARVEIRQMGCDWVGVRVEKGPSSFDPDSWVEYFDLVPTPRSQQYEGYRERARWKKDGSSLALRRAGFPLLECELIFGLPACTSNLFRSDTWELSKNAEGELILKVRKSRYTTTCRLSAD